MSGPYDVVGGSHGIEANLEDMDAVGGLIAGSGGALGELGLGVAGYLTDGNLLSTAPLSPVSFGRFETSLTTATGKIAGRSLSMEANGLFLQTKAKAYAAADDADRFIGGLEDHAAGMAYGLALGTAPLPTLAATAAVLGGQGIFDDPQAWMVEHPDELEQIVASVPGFLSLFDLGVYPYDTQDGAALLARLYDQDPADIARVDSPAEDMTQNPASLDQALAKLDRLGDHDDVFQIEKVGDGPNAVYNVYLPGTKVFDTPVDPGSPLPSGLEESDTVQNMGTNLAAVGGVDNAYEAAVMKAMKDAGVPPDAPVNLLGHSQGGIVAARLAQRMTSPDSDQHYNVTSVVTAGSPVDDIDLPESVKEVSLANEYDIVPRLDGAGYHDSSNHTTIVGHHQTDTVTGNHLLTPTYTPMAKDLEKSDDPAIKDALAQLAPFYTGGESQRTTYHMDRP